MQLADYTITLRLGELLVKRIASSEPRDYRVVFFIQEGPLRSVAAPFPEDALLKLAELTPKGAPSEVLPVLVQYYYSNKPEDHDWVVLPVSNLDAYFGTTAFSRKWLPALQEDLIERSISGYGVSRYRVKMLRNLETT